MPKTMNVSADTQDLTGKIALVTGASRGIGYETAKTLALSGVHVLALARTTGGLEELDDEIRAAGGSCSLIPADLTDTAAISQLGPALGERFGRLDIFVANAGVLGELAPITDIEPKLWTQVFDVNVHANWHLLRTLSPLLAVAPAGRAIFLTSRVGGEDVRAYWGGYAASKAALEMLAKTYASEMKETNIRVAIIDPGAMRTKMRATAMPGEDRKSLPHPKELGPLVLAAASPDYQGNAEKFIFREWKKKQSG